MYNYSPSTNPDTDRERSVIDFWFVFARIICVAVLVNIAFVIHSLITLDVPERTVLDANRAGQETCSGHGAVQSSNPVDTRRGQIASLVITCEDGYSQSVSPYYKTEAFAQFQKEHPWLGADDGRALLVVVLYPVASALAAIFALVILLNSRWEIDRRRYEQASRLRNRW